jgi:Protein of unknown function (DUF1488)
MSISFPNPSRSYDANRRRIRFWGHDGAIEVPFFLEEKAIFALYPKTKNSEADILEAFDLARERIFNVAAKAYAPGQGRGFYTLNAYQF